MATVSPPTSPTSETYYDGASSTRSTGSHHSVILPSLRGFDIESLPLPGNHHQHHLNTMLGNTHLASHLPLSDRDIEDLSDKVAEKVARRVRPKTYNTHAVQRKTTSCSTPCKAFLIFFGSLLSAGTVAEMYRESSEAHYPRQTSYYFGYGCLLITGLWCCLSGVKYVAKDCYNNRERG